MTIHIRWYSKIYTNLVFFIKDKYRKYRIRKAAQLAFMSKTPNPWVADYGGVYARVVHK